ncbi:DUF427 domain-containing protein [Jatrophihabitans sp.]|uniref:DUF427 domain-containing protein n=1 Tax=Jatrophihabitans sp. TaxID=1932789 RepID=UPI0030C70115|nr:hypothetical protein [Jatrophihabitans sp.]
MTRPVLTPTAEHPITVTPTAGRVVVRSGETVIADTTRALTLAESTYPTVQYVPLADVDQALLRPSSTESYCPFKGDAGYYDVVTPSGEIADAIWFYGQPHDAVAEIAGHVAFYPDRVTIELS